MLERREDTRFIAAEVVGKNQVQCRSGLRLVLVVPARVVPAAAAGDLIGRETEQEEVLLARLLSHLDRGAVPRADRERLVKEMDDLSNRAVQADRNDPRVWMDRTYALEWQERWDAALEASAEGMRIDPYRDATLGARAWLLILSGRAAEALPVLDRAIAIDVGDQDGLRVDTGKLHYALDRYGIANTFEVYAGTHTSKVADRFQNHVMPFFSQNLCFQANCQ